MNNQFASKLAAKIRLRTAFLLARHIQAYRNGDAARFDRMVNAQGRGIVSYEIAVNNIRYICGKVSGKYPVTARMLARWLDLVG